MSHYKYGKHNKKRIDVWLRFRSNPDVLDLIKKSKCKRIFETVKRVIIIEDRPSGEVMLEVWASNIFDIMKHKQRYNVFHILTKPNENWICEGDLGKGLKE
jgi:hypothetical protein